MLFTSHHLGDVERLADRFMVLVEGRLVASLSERELAERLAARGFSEAELASVTCPIGTVGITSKVPEVIAVSVAAQILQMMDQRALETVYTLAIGSQRSGAD